MSEVHSMKNELREMEKLLQDIKKGARGLLDEPEQEAAETKRASTRILSGEQRRLVSSSSWARSTTKKEYPMTKRKADEPQTTIDVLRSERYVKTRTPEYTFGVRPSVERKSTNDEYFNGDYDVKVETLSTKKRPRMSTISKTARLDPYGYERPKIGTVAESAGSATVVDGADAVPGGDAMDIVGEAGSEDQQSEDRQHKQQPAVTVPKTYSFGKDKRFAEEPARPPVKSVEQEQDVSVSTDDIPDVEKAFKAVISKASSAVMGPAPSKSSHIRSNTTDRPTEPSAEEMHIEALAYRPRTPNITSMHPEHKFDKYKVTHSVELGTPGPGYYNIPDSAVQKPQKSHSKPVGTIYHTTSRPKKEAALNAKLLVEHESAASVGPGTYAVDKSYSYIKHKPPVMAIMRNADSKHTPQMERKLYFEQKAKDMREVHDNMRETNIDLVTTRVPTTSLAPPKWSKDDPRRRKIIQDHRLSNMRCRSVSRSDAASRIASILGRSLDDQDLSDRRSSDLYRSPERKYAAVEKRVPTGAFMGAEVSARRSTSARIQSRPGIANKIADEKFGVPAEQRFYGPQIPVPWAADRLPRSKATGRVGAGDEDEEGYESPLEDVNRMLAERAGQGSSLGEELHDTEYTQAYLKSRYSGSLQPKKPAVLMTEPKPNESRNAVHNKMTIEEAGFEYIGPQLQPDWLANSERRDLKHKNQALRMDLVPGREIRKLHQKGVAEVIDFTDRITAVDPMGPGYYDVSSNVEMAKAAEKAPGLPFSKAISRKDQVGAFGARPEAASEPISVAGEDDIGGLYFDDQLDIDFGAAKDKATEYKRNKSFQLYPKDRHKEPKPNLDDHLGGSWFEGMAEEVLKKPNAALDFSKMAGRPTATEQDLENELFEEIAGPVGGEIDLQVQDWHPNKPKPAPGYVMPNPAKQPRFPKDKPSNEKPYDPDAQLDPLPNYNYLKGKEPVLVNMDKMRGRVDEDSDLEQAILREVEGEEIDMPGAQEAMQERDEGITRGRAARSGQKRVPKAVDMSKQIGRADSDISGAANTIQGAQQLLDHLDGQPGARLYENPELTAPILRNQRDINRGDAGGARDWSKQPGRDLGDGAGADVLGEEFGGREELDLAPVLDGTSKHKKLQAGPEWQKGDNVPRFAVGKGRRVNADGEFVEEEGLLELADVDPGKFKKGMNGFGVPGEAVGSNMSNQVGRPAPHRDQEALAAAGLQPEELILEPGENPMTKKQPSAQFGSKGNTAGIERTLAGGKALQDMRVSQTELILDPNDDFMKKNIRGGMAMRNKAEQSNRHEDAVETEIRNSLEVLKLEPTDADRLTRRNPVSTSVMASKQKGRETRHEAQLDAEVRKSADVLALEPTDAASRVRVTGGTTMGNKTTRVEKAAETKALEVYNRASHEELKIEPNITATRVSIPNASAMASRETRIRSSQEDLADAEQRRSAEVLDLEPDIEGASSRRRLKSVNTMINTEKRFPTQKEAAIDEELQQELEPELLIIDPSDATVRKKGAASKFGSERTGRETVTKKPDAAGATTATTESAKRGTATAAATTGGLSGTGKSAVSASKPNAKATPASAVKGAKTSTLDTGSTKKTTSGSAAAAAKAPTTKIAAPSSVDEPSTPKVTVPQLTVKAPAPRPKNDVVYDNLSPNEMINMIDMQSKKAPTK